MTVEIGELAMRTDCIVGVAGGGWRGGAGRRVVGRGGDKDCLNTLLTNTWIRPFRITSVSQKTSFAGGCLQAMRCAN